MLMQTHYLGKTELKMKCGSHRISSTRGRCGVSPHEKDERDRCTIELRNNRRGEASGHAHTGTK